MIVVPENNWATQPEIPIIGDVFSAFELYTVVRKLSNGTFSGDFPLSAETMKSLCKNADFLQTLISALYEVYDTGMIPKDWTIGSLSPAQNRISR